MDTSMNSVRARRRNRLHASGSFRAMVLGSMLACSCVGVVGCATPSVEGQTPNVLNDASSARDLAFRYREEALALSRLADSLEVETNRVANSKEVVDQAAISRIQELRKQANAAFERAREYRSQVPHNQMY